ncbi:hypothetical protein [uncultured Amphritea sp.]|uniref:hypothetical protein n=1 Tax=uncultured Amphritea sp. TaxID=981605 RepID=UPI00261762BC|nr:hypothetical protein [uncultured Amphritea sp.]
MKIISDFLGEMKRQSERSRCLHFEHGSRCTEHISAHSIQNSGQLTEISENGHVYKINGHFSTLKKTGGKPAPKKIGRNDASTFLGFCGTHDTQLFRPIDTIPLKPTYEQVALYAYRSLCREYFVKENAVRTLENLKGHEALTKEKSEFLEAALKGFGIGFEGLIHHKRHYDNAISNGKFHEFKYTVFIAHSRQDLAFSGVLYPHFDFLGRQLQDLGVEGVPLDLITFFSAPAEEGWAIGIAWHESSDRYCREFLRSLATHVYEGASLDDAILRFVFSCCENHAIRMSWWDGLKEKSQSSILERVRFMTSLECGYDPRHLCVVLEGIAKWEFGHVLSSD